MVSDNDNTLLNINYLFLLFTTVVDCYSELCIVFNIKLINIILSISNRMNQLYG